MSDVVCFLLQPTNRLRRGLRVYRSSHADDPSVPLCGSSIGRYHNAIVWIDEVRRGSRHEASTEQLGRFATDPRWPVTCDACAYVFGSGAVQQIFTDSLWTRGDTGALVTLRDAPAGAMWDATWFDGDPHVSGLDGRTLVVKLPNGHDWMIDSRAKNCDSPCARCGVPYHQHHTPELARDHTYVDARPHKCWVRHGEPPDIHVDKNGVTCGAGGGSIGSGEGATYYHGFLHHGRLVQG